MHRDFVNFCVVTKCLFLDSPHQPRSHLSLPYRTDFLITASVDGHIKLWKKQDSGIEFVKHYRAHMTPVLAVSVSVDGQLFASVSDDGSAKVFDVVNFGQSVLLVNFLILRSR